MKSKDPISYWVSILPYWLIYADELSWIKSTNNNCLSPWNLLSVINVIYFCALISDNLNVLAMLKTVDRGLLLNNPLISSIAKTLFPTDSS